MRAHSIQPPKQVLDLDLLGERHDSPVESGDQAGVDLEHRWGAGLHILPEDTGLHFDPALDSALHRLIGEELHELNAVLNVPERAKRTGT